MHLYMPPTTMTNLDTHTKQSVPKGGKIEGLPLWDFEKR
jgi:hypothetical protein